MQSHLATRQAAWDRLMAVSGPQAQTYFDPRSGSVSNIMTAIPLIPGHGVGNTITLDGLQLSLGHAVKKVDASLVGELVTRFVTTHHEALGLDVAQLGEATASEISADLWQIRLPQQKNGVPVRYAQLSATVSHGNLVLLGTETWGQVNVPTLPSISADQAVDIGFTFVGGRSPADQLWQEPTLEIVPFAPQQFEAGKPFDGPIGKGYGHYLVWAFGFRRDSGVENWQVLVDAHSGVVLSFQDTNHYDGQELKGGVYPLTSTEICPTNATCGLMQSGEPMPFANTGLPAPNDFTNSGGVFDYNGGTVTTTLNGKYVRMFDNCGPVNESSAVGALDLSGSNGQHDCVSGRSSAGNTAASRSGFYELNKLIEVARGWLPNNLWLSRQITSNMNILNTCNAFYSTADGTINFYRSGGGCRNTGEIAAIFDHEWGHALDDNDSGGALSNSSEAYADIASIYRLRASCVAYGFFWTTDKGCGRTADGTGFNQNESQVGSYCDTNCSGVRDADWAGHVANTPATALGFSCTHCSTGPGPCGRQVHCAAAPSRQAAWDLVARDLQAAPFNMTREDAFNLGSKIFFQGSGSIGSWHACTCGGTSDGCGATNAYPLWLAADDDDGNLNNGTPHMTAIFAAFDRHGIACPTPTPLNSGCVGGPTTAPVVTASSSNNNQIGLTWSAVPGATSYRVMRAEGFAGCDLGKAVIGTVAGTSFTDSDVANERPYHYVVQPIGVSGACMGPGSSCVSASALPCSGAFTSDRSVYNCSDTITLRLDDADLRGAGTQVVSVSSSVETTPEIVTLVESPAGSGRFSGTIATSSAPPIHNGVLNVAHGSIVTMTYVDASSCGTANVTKTRTATIDCTGQACFGALSLDRTLYSCSDTIQITVTDSDLIGSGTQPVRVTSPVETVPEVVILVESPAGSGTYLGSISTTSAPPTPDGRISTTDLSNVTVEYLDASPCGTSAAAVQRSASIDCAAPVISGVGADSITGRTANLKWNTDETSSSQATYGASIPPATNSALNSSLVTAHLTQLTDLPECTRQYYSVRSADRYGQLAVANNAGNYFQFTTGADFSVARLSPDPPIVMPAQSTVANVARAVLDDARKVVDVKVRFNLAHTADGNVTVRLRHPDGSFVNLSSRRGDTGDNFDNTLFDDAAITPISAGVPPYAGSFKPESPLAAFAGKSAQGTWQLEVIDDFGVDSGTIIGFELQLTLTQACGPGCAKDTFQRLSDSCAAGGAGNADGHWDEGETAAIRVALKNTGTDTLTGVYATLIPVTPGVTMIEDTRLYPEIPRNGVADSSAPHFIAHLPLGAACGSTVQFNVEIHTHQGVFTDALSIGPTGEKVPAGRTTDLFEDFAAGIPTTWTVEDKGSGGGAASTWTTSNPGGRAANPPITEPFAIVDSQAAGAGASQEERLITPTLDLSAASSVTVEFDSFFNFGPGGGDERGDVDVRSTLTGGDFVNVFRYNGASSANPDHRVVDITAQAAGASDVVIQFRYTRGANDRWWQVDNVKVSHPFPESCRYRTCDQNSSPGEVLRLRWDTKTALSWTAATGAQSYSLYRGTGADLPKLLTAEADSCTRLTTTATSATSIAEQPAAGSMSWWLVRASNGSGEGPVGQASQGPRLQSSRGACP
ncbi:MAG: proprotein convertase P-domain-containing protein [Acidobacteriota bacterium]